MYAREISKGKIIDQVFHGVFSLAFLLDELQRSPNCCSKVFLIQETNFRKCIN